MIRQKVYSLEQTQIKMKQEYVANPAMLDHRLVIAVADTFCFL